MSKYLNATAIVMALTVMALAIAPDTLAATEVGSDCEANAFIAGATILPLAAAPASSLPVSVPIAGIATKWRVRIAGPEAFYQRLKVFRPTADPHRFQVIAEGGREKITESRGSFDIRIPVQPGDRFGISDDEGLGAMACQSPRAGDVEGIFLGKTPSVGSTVSFAEDTTYRAAVSAIIEPDADGDGYGDESQDGCPEYASLQIPCPAVSVKLVSTAVKQHAILIGVEPSSEAQVQIFGQVAWHVRQVAQQMAQRLRKPTHGLTVGLSAGAPRALQSGHTATFRLPLGKAVSRRLGRITPRQALQALITVRSTDLAGRESDRRLRLKLHGRER